MLRRYFPFALVGIGISTSVNAQTIEIIQVSVDVAGCHIHPGLREDKLWRISKETSPCKAHRIFG
jgi:hypothetical protein